MNKNKLIKKDNNKLIKKNKHIFKYDQQQNKMINNNN